MKYINIFLKLIISIFYIGLIPFIILYILFFIGKKKEKIIWGPIPMINYKYWSNAIKNIGYDSVTLVSSYYTIHEQVDFELYYSDMIPKILNFNKKANLVLFGPFFSFLYVVKNAKIINISFMGGYLGTTCIWFLESFFYKLANIKVVVSGYGGDFYMYSKLIDPSLRHVLLMSYPDLAKSEELINKKVKYWTKKADIILNGFQLDGLGRWDCLPVNMICLDNSKIMSDREYIIKSEVNIIHSPNHRGFKGTEFIVNAINQLKQEGYNINFILLENVKNQEVLKILKEADILIEQIITGYGLNAMEGMANGLAVMSNITNNYYQVLRRYSYLNECPILSTNPENIKENLRLLIENKELREELGRLGIEYVRKYHSEETAQYMYGKIYNQLLNGVDEDLINMFHPLKSEYNKKNYIKTPLINNQYIKNNV